MLYMVRKQKLLKQGYAAPWLNHCYKYSTIVIMNWMTVTKYPFLKWHFFFLFSITDKTFTKLDYMSNTVGVLLEARTASPSQARGFSLFFFFVVGSSMLVSCSIQ